MSAECPLDALAGKPFTVDVEDDPLGPAPRLVVAGELDGATAGRLHRAVIDLLRRRRPAAIDLDLAAVTFVDTGGVRSLLECLVDAEQLARRLRLARPSPLVHRVLRAVDLLEAFGLVPEPAGSGRR